MSMYLNASNLAGNTHMAASMNIVANTDGKKTEVNQLIELKAELNRVKADLMDDCLLYTSPSPRDGLLSRMPSSA